MVQQLIMSMIGLNIESSRMQYSVSVAVTLDIRVSFQLLH